MKKLFISIFAIVTLVALGEGFFIFTKMNDIFPKTERHSNSIKNSTQDSVEEKQDAIPEINENKTPSVSKSIENEVPRIGPLTTNYEPYFLGKYDESIRTYVTGENGRPLYEEILPYGEFTHYAFNFSLQDYEIIQLSEFAYRTLQDCAYIQSSALLPKSSAYTVDEYISGELNGNKPFEAFRVKTNERGVFYIPVSISASFLENWKKSEIMNIDGTDYRIFPFSGGVWYNNSTEFYEQPNATSPVSFIYDYSKLGIKNGFDYYPKITEAAIALNGSDYWVKVETEIGSGWISSSIGNVERGGPLFHFPEDYLRFELNLP